jgi:hypothetical protein
MEDRMRPILALTILLLGLRTASPEQEIEDSLLVADANPYSSSLEFESSVGKADREFVLAVPASTSSDQGHDQIEEPVWLQTLAPTNADVESNEGASQSLDDLCAALLVSAETNHLPVPFFANLIWQESRLQNDAISPVGALGIAQFMPEVAVEAGVGDPFDPRQAIPASARFLHALHTHFGNLGFAAAAYNAGTRRVREWLDRGRALPRETRTYVVRVTGQSVDQWRKTPLDDAKLTFAPPLPCRGLPAFADMEQAQLEQAQLEQAQSAQLKLAQVQVSPEPAAAPRRANYRAADRKHPHAHMRRAALRVAARNLRGGKREARFVRSRREKHRSA